MRSSAPGTKSHSIPSRSGVAADELAVGVEVVARVLLPERVAPEVERLAEAVDVLGDAQLLDPGRRGGGQVALDVLGGEVALDGGPVLVRAQVQVVVGQHGVASLDCGGEWAVSCCILAARLRSAAPASRSLLGAISLGIALGVGQLCFAARSGLASLLRATERRPRSASSSSASRRSSGVVTLRFCGGDRVDQHRAPRRLDQHRLVGGGVAAARSAASASRSASARNTCGVCAAQSRDAIQRRLDRERRICHLMGGKCDRSVPAGPLDRVGDRGGGDRAGGLGVGVEVATSASISSGVSSGRAASWIATSSVSTAARALATDCGPGGAAVDDAEVVAAEVVDVPGRAGDDDRAHRRRGRGRPRSTTRPSACRPAARRPSGRRLRAAPRSRRPR